MTTRVTMYSMRNLLLLVLFLACAPARATTGDLWPLLVGTICLYQDPGYRSTPIGGMLARTPRFENMNSPENRALSKCFQSGEWISKQLCQAVMNATEEELSKPQKLYDLHAREIRTLQTPADYIARPEGQACPSYTAWLAEKKAADDEELKRNRAQPR